MQNKFKILALLLIFNIALGFAQTDRRTQETKIADAVMLLPATNTADLNKLMVDLSKIDNVIPQIAKQLLSPAEGDDSKARYAITGLTMFVAQNTNPALRQQTAQDLCKAIVAAKNDEIRDYLLIQLQFVAGNESVATISQYLTNKRLCDAAVRVLVRINTNDAKEALLQALENAKDTGNEVFLISGLGLTKNNKATSLISSFVNGQEAKLQKPALNALAHIAAPESEPILALALAKVAYVYEPTDALDSYLLYLQNRLLAGDKAMVTKASKKLLSQTTAPNQLAARCIALDIYAQASQEKALPEIFKALKSDSKIYRVAALNSSAKINSSKTSAELIKKAKSEKNPIVKAEIIEALGKRGDKDALPIILDALNDKNTIIVQAAIIAGGKIDKQQMLLPIIKIMNNGDKQIVEAGKNVLLSTPGTELLTEIAQKLPTANANAQLAFIDILAQRKATNYANEIVALCSSPLSDVQNEAYKALKSVMQLKDLSNLSNILINAPKEQVMDVQDAIYQAIKSAGDQEKQTALIAQEMSKQGAKKILYYNVLAKIGGKSAINIVSDGFYSTDQTTRPTAFEALTRWSDFAATESLFAICKADPSGTYFDQALRSYTSKINPSKNTNDQKLLLLRRALEIAKTNEQKNEIIKEIGKTGTFLAMITASEFLDNTALQQSAVGAVMSVALKSNRYSGTEVNRILRKAIAVNKDPEAEYQKQAILKYIASYPEDGGYVSMFNGKDLKGWKGLVDNPIARGKMTKAQLAAKQKKADEIRDRDWRVEDGTLVFDGPGYDNLCSEKMYADYDLTLDWRITAGGDAGIYLRGTPQVQIWDTALVKVGAQVGSGGLYNNRIHQSIPLVVADNGVNLWNTFRIRMQGDKVTVYLNGILVTDKVVLENYWDGKQAIFPTEAIELQAHGERVEYRNVYVKELPRVEPAVLSAEEQKEGFVLLFNGVDMTGWIGNTKDYFAQDGSMKCEPKNGGSGNLYTEREYDDFVFRFEFQLTPAANNGLGIRTPMVGDPAYAGMELQILDDEDQSYKDLAPYQYHGSVYGVITPKRGHLKPLGEWNVQEVMIKGYDIKITLNGVVITEGNLAKASKNFTETLDKQNHPGLSNTKGHIGFLGHGSEVAFRNIRIKKL